MRQAEAGLVASGRFGIETLMDKAAQAIADAFSHHLGQCQEVAVLIGGGNNGGDAASAGILLAQAGHPVRVYTATSRRTALTAARLATLLQMPGVRACSWGEPPDSRAGMIDGLLGTGLFGPLRSDMMAYLDQAAAWGLPTVACDLPSGLDPDSGELLCRVPKATVTVALGALKPGVLLGEGPACSGVVELADLGMNRADLGSRRQWLSVDQVPPAQFRPADHKGDRGRVLILAGSPGLAGAAALATLGALRGAAGLVRLAIDQALEPRFTEICPEATTLALAPDDQVAASALTAAIQGGFRLVAAGPGLGRQPRPGHLLAALFQAPWQKMVLDADALWHLAHGVAWPENRAALVITPHQGEFDALFADLDGTLLAQVEEASRRTNATVLLKGPTTILASASETSLISGAHDLLAQGGSGDVLTGLIAACLGRHDSVHRAAVEAVSIHGRASQRLFELSGRGAGARALTEQIPFAMKGPQ